MWEAIALIRSTDVFLGMHGAGFANLLAMHQVSLQGWGLLSRYRRSKVWLSVGPRFGHGAAGDEGVA